MRGSTRSEDSHSHGDQELERLGDVGSRGTTPYESFIVITVTIVSVVPFFVFRTTKTNVLVHLYPKFPL